MMPGGNLLVTHDPHHRDVAREHAAAALERLGAGARFLEDPHEGVFEVQVAGDPRALVRAAADLCARDPAPFARTHRWRPVDLWARAGLDDMVEAARSLAPRIGPGDAWKLTVQVHGPSRHHARGLVEPLTDPIRGGRVDLERPTKEVRADLLGERAAFAVLGPGDELSVDRVEMALAAGAPGAGGP